MNLEDIEDRTEKTRIEWIDEEIRRILNYPKIIHWVCLIMLGGLLWGILASITDEFVPGSQLFGMAALFVLAYAIGAIADAVRIPPLLGMLVTGGLLRNVGFIQFSGVFIRVASILRHTALFIILTRAGLGLDLRVLKNLSFLILRLGFIPALVEGAVITVLSYFILGLPWMWALLSASIMCAVSPAVVIPLLFTLQENGYGVDKGIPTVVVAAASLDDIYSISLFGVIFGMLFSEDSSLVVQTIKGPLGLFFGVIFGVAWGIVLHYIPHRDSKYVVLFRVLMLVGGGLLFIFGSDRLGYAGAGPLGCIVAPFVAYLGWKKDGWTVGNNPVSEVFAAFWKFFQPILFGLIGSEIDILILKASTVANGVLTIIGGLTVRTIATLLAAFGGLFNWKEKIFLAIAWLPKATVQAALGPLALDKVRKGGSQEEMEYAEKVLIISVLAILITAPIGAIAITFLGPRLLNKNSPNVTSWMSRNQRPDKHGDVEGD